jgi:hypothetical protein
LEAWSRADHYVADCVVAESSHTDGPNVGEVVFVNSWLAILGDVLDILDILDF